MLVLSRKAGQSIDVTGPCQIKILETRRNTVRIGITAEDGAKILRTELIEIGDVGVPKPMHVDDLLPVS